MTVMSFSLTYLARANDPDVPGIMQFE